MQILLNPASIRSCFYFALMPMLYPSSMHEFIELGLLGIAMSRYSGCWVGYKVISETVETTSVIDLKQEKKQASC